MKDNESCRGAAMLDAEAEAEEAVRMSELAADLQKQAHENLEGFEAKAENAQQELKKKLREAEKMVEERKRLQQKLDVEICFRQQEKDKQIQDQLQVNSALSIFIRSLCLITK